MRCGRSSRRTPASAPTATTSSSTTMRARRSCRWTSASRWFAASPARTGLPYSPRNVLRDWYGLQTKAKLLDAESAHGSISIVSGTRSPACTSWNGARLPWLDRARQDAGVAWGQIASPFACDAALCRPADIISIPPARRRMLCRVQWSASAAARS